MNNTILFGLAVFEETIVKGAIRENNEFLSEQGEIEWQNIKTQGIDEIESFLDTDLAKDNLGLSGYKISQEMLDKILKRDIISVLDIIEEFENVDYYVVIRKVKDENRNDSIWILETIVVL